MNMNPQSFPRRSLVYRRLVDAQMSFAGHGDMCLGEHARGDSATAPLKLVDLSVVPRWGLKGRGIEAWLARNGITIPAEDNRAELQADGSLLARLSPGDAAEKC